MTESTYHRWRNQFGGMEADDAKRLRELQRENSHRQRAAGLVSFQRLACQLGDEAIERRWTAPGPWSA